jgi:ribosomal protein S18 acetylase RimI-like enzyme
LATRLGKCYVTKTLDWFLHNPNRFLFHIEEDNKVVGYCGGFIPAKIGDGSSSGMLQHAFNEAIKGIVLRPWLLFHAEVVAQYPFLWRNIKRKVTGKVVPAATPTNRSGTYKQYVGLVVIGVRPENRGAGIAQLLMEEFEKKSLEHQQHYLVLSVKKDNLRAIKAYHNFGWSIKEEAAGTYVLHKTIC